MACYGFTMKEQFFFVFVLLTTFHVAWASNGFDFGDTLALIIGLSIGIIAFFACLGAYARRQSQFDRL